MEKYKLERKDIEGIKKENKAKYYLIWVPFYVERKYVREFYNKDLEELREELDIEKLQNLKLTLLDIKRRLGSQAYKTYIKLREASWWASLDKELKYKILYLKFPQLVIKENRNGKDFYPVHYRDKGKAYVIPFEEYVKMLNKKETKGKSIREQLKKKEEKMKKEREKRILSEKFLKGEL